MAPFLRVTWAVFRKDLAVERRAKEGINGLAFFALLLLFLFYFALGPDGERLRAALPGLFWLTFVLAGLLGLGRAFASSARTRASTAWSSPRATRAPSTSASSSP